MIQQNYPLSSGNTLLRFFYFFLLNFNKKKSYPHFSLNTLEILLLFFLGIIILFKLTLTSVNLKHKQCYHSHRSEFTNKCCCIFHVHVHVTLFHSIAHISFYPRIFFSNASWNIFPFPINNVTEQNNKM